MKIAGVCNKVLSTGVVAWALHTGPALAATFNVTFGDYSFSPNSLTIDVGDTVVWNGGTGHTVTGVAA